MDLSQAEAVADIIHSKTSEFAKASVKNLSGVLKEGINDIRNQPFCKKTKKIYQHLPKSSILFWFLSHDLYH